MPMRKQQLSLPSMLLHKLLNGAAPLYLLLRRQLERAPAPHHLHDRQTKAPYNDCLIRQFMSNHNLRSSTLVCSK